MVSRLTSLNPSYRRKHSSIAWYLRIVIKAPSLLTVYFSSFHCRVLVFNFHFVFMGLSWCILHIINETRNVGTPRAGQREGRRRRPADDLQGSFMTGLGPPSPGSAIPRVPHSQRPTTRAEFQGVLWGSNPCTKSRSRRKLFITWDCSVRTDCVTQRCIRSTELSSSPGCCALPAPGEVYHGYECHIKGAARGAAAPGPAVFGGPQLVWMENS